MLVELMVGAGMVLLTVTLHGIGLFGLGHVLRTRLARGAGGPLSPRGLLLTIALVLGLFVLHGLEIWLYAFLYHALGAVADFRTAVYFSTITYGTVGYDDTALDPAWDLVAGIEGINGVLLIGWSVAVFVTLMDRMARGGRRDLAK